MYVTNINNQILQFFYINFNITIWHIYIDFISGFLEIWIVFLGKLANFKNINQILREKLKVNFNDL